MTQNRAMGPPDSTSSDQDLYHVLVHDLSDHGRVTEVRPGVIQVELPADEAERLGIVRVEIRMTPGQLRETVTVLAADGQQALGVADPVAAGWSLFSIHLEEDLATLQPGESFLLWHHGTLHPAVELRWPPVRAVTRG